MRMRSEDRLKPGLQRRGFTLVELLVAAALSIVIMTIMALAFQSAMGTLSNLKAMGDQADRLRTAEVMLRADLDSDHVVGDDSGGTVKVSDLRFDQGTGTVKAGYFAVTAAAGLSEGNDSDGIPSFKSNGANNSLAMTVRRNSKTPVDLFGISRAKQVTDTLGTLDGTQWAEVKWQLGNPTTIGGVQMFPLHRIVSPLAGTPPKAPSGLTPAASGTATFGDDIVMTNVLSFEVKPLIFNTAGALVAGTDPPYSDTSWTTAPAATALTTRCVAVLIKIRLYDIKTKQTRQMSLIVKV